MYDKRPINPLSRPWLLLAIGAIGLSALFAVLLVVARTPLLQQLFGGADLFHTVLVLHVNFSVLIWLLAYGGLLWSLSMRGLHPLIDPLAFGLVMVGALLISLSPLLSPPPQPVMSNYIPILYSSAFLGGLCSFATGIGLYALRRLASRGQNAAANFSRLAALLLVVSLVALMLTLWRLPVPLAVPAAFEMLFWGGGHLLQFVYLLLLVSCWQLLHPQGAHRYLMKILLAVVVGVSVVGLGLSLALEPDSAAYRDAFTQLMRYGTPLLIVPALVLLWQRRGFDGLRMSQLLLLSGLLLGVMIRGDNVSVTAHYHATNAAITIAFMALAYRLLEGFGLGRVQAEWSQRQLQLYFFGMLIYVGGMALSGQLDVPRKVPMTAEGSQALAMGLMGLGGLIAISATLLFVSLNIYAVYNNYKKPLCTVQQRDYRP